MFAVPKLSQLINSYFYNLELSFDNRGNLKPYEINIISIEEFRHTYVDAFSENERRSELFKCYQKYSDDLSKLITNDFYQWIDGSYVSNKQNPRDIDIVSILHYQDYESNLKILQQNFSSIASRTKYNVDGYIVVNYPDTHKKHIFTKSDLSLIHI